MIKLWCILLYTATISGFIYIPLQSDDSFGNSIVKRQSTVPLTYEYFYLFGDISIGTPAQKFRVLFDTGSPTLWIRSDSSTSGSTFNPSASSSFRRPNVVNGSIGYVDGTYITGYYAMESVSIGSVKFKNFSVLMATDIVTPHNGRSDGIVGLSFHDIQKGNGSIIKTLLKNETSNSRVFSYFIDLRDSSGGLTFGGIDTARYFGPLLWIPVTPSVKGGVKQFLDWSLNLTNLTISDINIIDEPIKLLMDTGTSCSAFSPAIARKINTLLDLEEISIGLPYITYGVRCDDGDIDKFQNITLDFSGKRITISSRTYMFLEMKDQKLYCVSGMFGLPQISDDLIILGNLILRQFYTVFDYGSFKIGLAEANRQIDVTPIIVAADSRNPPLGISDPKDIGGIGASGTSIKVLNYTVFIVAAFLMLGICYLIVRQILKKRREKRSREIQNSINRQLQTSYNPVVSHHYVQE